MKKILVQSISKLAESLPTVFIQKEETILMTGEELRLTPYGDVMRLEKEALYEVPVPLFVAVDHYQQIKDAYKKGGLEAVEAYKNDVLYKYMNSETRNLPAV